MNTTNKRRMQLSIFTAAVLAIVAVAAVMMAAGGNPAQATTATLAVDGAGDDNPLPPQQGGPGGPPGGTPTPPQQTEPDSCSDSPAQVVSSGRYALLDVYWDPTDKYLVNNPCPPAVTHNADETVTRIASNIDIGRTIMHVSGDSNLTPRANSDADYAKWPFLYPNAVDNDDNGTVEGSEIGEPYSTNVWALHDCSHDADPPPTEHDLCIGVSAGLLRASDWRHIDFEMESVRQPSIAPQDRGQAFVFYKYDDVPLGEEQVLWGTRDPSDTGIDIAPGEYLHPRWAFTQPGTYRFQVHVNGVVDSRSTITRATSVTSEVSTYTFYVGPLTLNQAPVFGIERAVPENSAAGVAAGRPAPVLDEDAGDTHTFNLTGGGADKFTLSATGDGVQIVVADGAVLNYEDRQSYDLTLQVSDGKDRFSHVDDSVDDTIPVRIVVEDDPNEQLAVTLEADRTTQTIGQGVRLTARVHNSPVSSGRLSYRHHEQNVGGGSSLTELTHETTRTVTWDGAPVSREYTMTVWVTDGGTNAPQVTSNRVVIDWTN